MEKVRRDVNIGVLTRGHKAREVCSKGTRCLFVAIRLIYTMRLLFCTSITQGLTFGSTP